MPLVQHPLSSLQNYLPNNCFDKVVYYLTTYKVKLTITKKRKTILGNYKIDSQKQQHEITVNGNLNKYAFLITLLHEIAHLLTFEQYKNRVAAHGKEWKQCFGNLLQFFLDHSIFPGDVLEALNKSAKNPAASSCADDDLVRILKKYDSPSNANLQMIEKMPLGAHFKLENGEIFTKGEKLRKRYKCQNIKTKQYYLFSPVYEALVIN